MGLVQRGSDVPHGRSEILVAVSITQLRKKRSRSMDRAIPDGHNVSDMVEHGRRERLTTMDLAFLFTAMTLSVMGTHARYSQGLRGHT